MPPMDQALSHSAQIVRRLDRDRFVTALFAPADRREALMALYAFNAEVASVRESVREPAAGLMRLQWWREILAGERAHEAARHPVALPLLEAARAARPPGELFERLLEARERDLSPQPFAEISEVEAYAADTSGGLHELAAWLLGATGPETLAAARLAGTGWGLVGLLRAVAFHRSIGRPALPGSPQALGERARELLDEASRLGWGGRGGRAGLPALLPATLGRAYLGHLEGSGWNVADPAAGRYRPMPLRLAWAMARGKA